MPYFFGRAQDGRVAIEGEDARHLARSLRSRPGEVIDVVDRAGLLLRVRLDRVSDARVEGAVEASLPHRPEPGLKLTVAVAMLPSAALESALARCTELGAHAFVVVQAARSVGRAGAKPARWSAICREAAMLAGRLVVPEVVGPLSLTAALGAASNPVLLDRRGGVRLAELELGGKAELLVGPEGGWTDAEIELVAQRATLGPRNLRAENAAAAAVAVALSAAGDL